MLSVEEKGHLRDARGDSDVFGSIVHLLLDDGRIEDIPDAEAAFLEGCEYNKNYKRGFLRTNWIVGPITHRYVLPKLGKRLSQAEKAFPNWSLDPANRYTDRILDAMSTGQSLRREIDTIISEIKKSVE